MSFNELKRCVLQAFEESKTDTLFKIQRGLINRLEELKVCTQASYTIDWTLNRQWHARNLPNVEKVILQGM